MYYGLSQGKYIEKGLVLSSISSFIISLFQVNHLKVSMFINSDKVTLFLFFFSLQIIESQIGQYLGCLYIESVFHKCH